jgi:hypothetical protein
LLLIKYFLVNNLFLKGYATSIQAMTDKNHPIYQLSKEEVLYHLLKKEHGYYKAIMEISQQEYANLESRQPFTQIAPLLKKKKILLTCISEIDAALAPLKKYWQSKKDRSDPYSEKIKIELDALNKLLKEILQMDLVSQKNLEHHLLTLKEKEKPKDDNAAKLQNRL